MVLDFLISIVKLPLCGLKLRLKSRFIETRLWLDRFCLITNTGCGGLDQIMRTGLDQ
ncbi:hypothetical protein RchiOBHm_Chr1g0333091 [Rosa chinensis]|uniref:Uncharacterized protein n=1 Tax=Rosa chinensis TaxID=74649 RepID=A0A2P6SBY0_ROSCH|nr:hypothetical protein RchiOBHm_Chr1g0333091 [Rosa chinensis]